MIIWNEIRDTNENHNHERSLSLLRVFLFVAATVFERFLNCRRGGTIGYCVFIHMYYELSKLRCWRTCMQYLCWELCAFWAAGQMRSALLIKCLPSTRQRWYALSAEEVAQTFFQQISCQDMKWNSKTHLVQRLTVETENVQRISLRLHFLFRNYNCKMGTFFVFLFLLFLLLILLCVYWFSIQMQCVW